MITALLVATRDILRDELKFKPEECMVQDDGVPSPTCGERFIAIHGLDHTPGVTDLNLGIEELGSIAVTITYRFSATPYDIRGQELYVTQSIDIDNLANDIKSKVHQNYNLIHKANNMLRGNYKIIEPLRWAGGDAQPQTRDSFWFSSEDMLTPNKFAGLSLTVRFSQAKRIQSFLNTR